MFFVHPTLDLAMTYVQGVDAGCVGGFLVGFREWLIVRIDGGNNLFWTGLVKYALFPGSSDPAKDLDSCENQESKINEFLDLLDSFWSERCEPNGIHEIYIRYQHWLKLKEAQWELEARSG